MMAQDLFFIVRKSDRCDFENIHLIKIKLYNVYLH